MCVSVKLLCGLEASQGAVEEVLSSAVSVGADALDSSDDLDEENEAKVALKKKNKRRKGITCNLLLVHKHGEKSTPRTHSHRTYRSIYCDIYMYMFSQPAVRVVMVWSIQ